MVLKLNNRLVDHRISENSTVLLVLSKVHGILILKQSTVLGVERCSLIAGVPKTACNFQHQENAVLSRWNFSTRGNFIRGIDCDYQKELKISTRWPKWIFAEKCKQFWEPLQSASTSQHLKPSTELSTELSTTPIKPYCLPCTGKNYQIKERFKRSNLLKATSCGFSDQDNFPLRNWLSNWDWN